jgi:hypothetical protein
MSTTPSPFLLKYVARLEEALTEIPKAIERKIDDESFGTLTSIQKPLPAYLKGVVKLSSVAWESIRHLCGSPMRGVVRPEFSTSVPPLARTLLDTLFNTVYLFDNTGPNMRWYFAAGWRNLQARRDRLRSKHGSDPIYMDWLNEMDTVVDELKQDAQITPAEETAPESIDYWPIPGRMINKKNKRTDGSSFRPTAPARQSYLQLLYREHYGFLSSASHLSHEGLVRRAGFLFGEPTADQLALATTHAVMPALTFFVAILSEIALELGYEYEQKRLRRAWNEIKVWPDAAELLKERYDQLLPPA